MLHQHQAPDPGIFLSCKDSQARQKRDRPKPGLMRVPYRADYSHSREGPRDRATAQEPVLGVRLGQTFPTVASR